MNLKRERRLAWIWLGVACAAGSPSFATEATPIRVETTASLVARARSQYLAGEPAAAAETFRQVEAREPGNADAQYFLGRIEREKANAAARRQASIRLMAEVDEAWKRPSEFVAANTRNALIKEASGIRKKLEAIIVPEVNFSGMELGRVVHALGVMSAEYDPTESGPKGINVVLIDPEGSNPAVTIRVQRLSLKRLLELVAASVGFQCEIQEDAVVMRPAANAGEDLATRFFPVSQSAILRMTGELGGAGVTAGSASLPADRPRVRAEAVAIQEFLQLAGVDFAGVAGSSLAFDGSQLIATHSARNLERIRNILIRYAEVRQVEIEAKFMEVQQGALEELGVQWNLATKASASTRQSRYTNGGGINRTLAEAFRNATSSQQISISGSGQSPEGLNIPTPAPVIPGGVMLGTAAGPLATVAGVVGEFDVQAMIRALSQRSGTELLSAPKLTVLSGNPATMTVAQELRYPQSYGQIQSQVGTGSVSGGGSAGVSITSGTPQEFTTRNVGVELKVTPTVEEDDYSISLDLHPKVTEFEGFVEYGGPSVAISGGTTVTVPPGFYQPIFAVREVSTKVTIWDGATLVMGGLTREDVKQVSDKVPVLGNLPGVGRLFRSKGESSQKRNLLIFVTANLVTPGGTLRKQATRGEAGVGEGMFEHPVIGKEEAAER